MNSVHRNEELYFRKSHVAHNYREPSKSREKVTSFHRGHSNYSNSNFPLVSISHKYSSFDLLVVRFFLMY